MSNIEWEYMEIVDFTKIYVGQDVEQGFKICDASNEKKYEYSRREKNIIVVLNNYGEEGWEVIAVRERLDEYKDEQTGQLKFSSHEVIYTLKREIT